MPKCFKRITAMMLAVLTIGFALPALDRLHVHTYQKDLPKLTPKELEVRKWTVAGKPAFAASSIFGSTERAASYYVQNNCAKLGVFNMRSALVQALELKLVVWFSLLTCQL